jgi:hypothetical protein
MRLDMANFTINAVRPHIQAQSVEYERKKFSEFLAVCPGTYLKISSQMTNVSLFLCSRPFCRI